MSHFECVRSQMTSKDLLIKACEAQGAGEVLIDSYVRGYMNQCTGADVIIRTNGLYDIGYKFSTEEGVFIAVADFGYGECSAGDKGLTELNINIQATYAKLHVEDLKKQADRLGLGSAQVNTIVH